MEARFPLNSERPSEDAAPRASVQALVRLRPQLDRTRFVRIHRSTIVNAGRIRENQPWFHNDYVVLLADGSRVMTGRAYRAAVKGLMGER